MSFSGTKKEGFISLFNGEDFNGLYIKIRKNDPELAKKVFAIDNGQIHVFKDFPKEYELNIGKKETHSMIYTDKIYSKFIFKFKYKWGEDKANNFNKFQHDAGIYYHVVDDKIWPKGLEYQVRYNHVKDKNHTGDYWGRDMT